MTEVEWIKEFGTNLKRIMYENNITRRELSKDTGLTEVSVSRYINGLRVPSTITLLKLAYALDCDLDDLADFGSTIK